MMNLCSIGHSEVCFEERYCPCCEVLHKLEKNGHLMDEQEDELIKLSNVVSNLEKEVLELREQLHTHSLTASLKDIQSF